MLETVRYILRFTITTKHVIYGAILRGVWGSAVSSPSRVWGGDPMEIKFDAL